MLKRFSPLELVGKTALDFDIMDAKGKVLYAAGTKLNPNIIMKMNQQQLFAEPPEEKIRFLDDEFELSGNPEIKSIISDDIAEGLIENTKKILYAVFDQKTPEISVCEETRDIILNEVSDKLEKADCIGRLRVYDHYTYSHTVNVSAMASALGMMLSFDENSLKDLALGALLHDIGKMKVSKLVLNKPDKLTDEEYAEMKNHTIYGYQTIKNDLQMKEDIALVALQHQEKYGGTGYPNGLKGKEIHLYAQVTSICDVYDALVSERVYKKPIQSHEAIKLMMAEGSQSFNPFMLYKFIYLANYRDTSQLITSESKLTKEQSEKMDSTT